MDPRLPKKRVNHPCHLHVLNKTDVREAYDTYGAKWDCDTCHRSFDGYAEGSISHEEQEESEEPDQRHSYHCSLCNFDICSQCYKGHLHSFHCHRLQIARATLIYAQTSGQWRCDACKRVFTEDTEQTCYHCQDCKVDLCVRCFKGDWHHVLHDHTLHSLRPIDPRLEYRKHSTWICDHCTKQYTEEDSEIFFHCDECQYDLCTDCFHGKKHHLHKHGLIALRQNTRNLIRCSNCNNSVNIQYHMCRDPQCGYILCQACHVTTPKLHPYHAHPLELWDPRQVYPQSGGLWHCDRCTNSHPTKQQTPIPPSSDMYHCEKCEYDLCKKCYYGGLTPTQQFQQNSQPQSLAKSEAENLHRPYYRPQSYRTQDSQPHSLISSNSPPSYLSGGASIGVPVMVRPCMSCNVYPATVKLVHNGLPCTEVGICCRKCANGIVHYGKTCPFCGHVPESLMETKS